MTDLYAGLDVSLELTNVCIVDEDGRLLHESRVGSDPEITATELKQIGPALSESALRQVHGRQWMFFGLKQAGLPAVCIEARHIKERGHIKHLLGQKHLQLPVLFLERLELAGVRDFHPTALRTPHVEGRLADPMLPTGIQHRDAA